MRAREPDQQGVVTSGGVEIYYESFGAGPDTLLLVPPYQIVHSRVWKMQVPYLARYFRVVTYDGRGNGRSGRPERAYGVETLADDAAAVLRHLEIDRYGIVTLSAGSQTVMRLYAHHPNRIVGMIIIGGWADEAPGTDARWEGRRAAIEGDYDAFVQDFFKGVFTEAHSSKPQEDGWGWAHETTPATLIAASEHGWLWSDVRALVDRVTCPVLVVHGTDDARVAYRWGVDLHERLSSSRLVTIDRGGHLPNVRDPVMTNLLIRDFFGAPKGARSTWGRALTRPRRALFVSSPIGLGHIQRDLAIARELRSLVPDLEIHWWSQHPVTRVLQEAGETVHPLSHRMASESRHWEEESREHELHAFGAFRRMDEIFLYNFMLFHDLVKAEPYDLWIGDESWEVDYYLHENPELKTAPYVFLTDVIGFLPVTDDPREHELTADYNAEMISQRSRYPYLRDRSLYIGDLEDLPDGTFGRDLPNIRAWARDWFEPIGYILPFDPGATHDPRELRQRLGYGTESGPLLFSAVGGTAVGRALLEKTARAFERLRSRVPDARMIMVTGPRIDAGSLPDVEGLEKRAYVHDLHRHLACCDAAVVQGGLSTTMELTALKRPFAYAPLRGHWEQSHHVAHRLERYRAGVRVDYSTVSADDLALTLERLLSTPVDFRDVAPGAARRAASRIAELLERPGSSRRGDDE